MVKIVFFLVTGFLMSGCSGMLVKSHCGIPLIRGVQTPSELECIDNAHAQDQNYHPDTALMDKLKEQERVRQERRFEADIEKCFFTVVHLEEPIGGVVRAPSGLQDEAIKESIKRFCTDKNKPSWKIKEIRSNKEYAGSVGGGSTYCSQYGCSGSSNAVARYSYFDEVDFDCVGIDKK